MSMPQSFSFSQDFDILWRAAAAEVLRSTDKKSLREAVMRLSDFFIRESGEATPWGEGWASQSYALYFHPLNYLRARRAVRKAHERGFFASFRHFVDWGCGLGALTSALRDELPEELTGQLTVIGVDQSKEALKGFEKWNAGAFSKVQVTTPERFTKEFTGTWESTCLGLSYSLNELTEFNLLAHSPGALFLLEPSTFGLARSLQSFRKEALNAGYFAWSPCPHQDSCPLLTASRKDWCFDRLHTNLPDSWEELFSELPIKNKTITLSHMALRRQPPKNFELPAVRLVGDELSEKGKVKWLACAGEQKFFLVWLTKWGSAPDWKRGDLLLVPPELSAESRRGGEIKISPDRLARIKKIFAAN